MKITLLGTGTSQGIPVIGCPCPVCHSADPKDRRFRTSAIVESDMTRLLIDVGPDFRQQMLQNDFDDLDGILITHEHNDHVNGMDDVRPINFRKKKTMPVYAGPQVKNILQKRFDYIFNTDNPYPGRPRISLHTVPDSEFNLGDLHILPVRVMHGHLPVLGFRFGRFCYITDAKTIPEAEMDKLRGLDVLILNALHHRPHYSHLNLEEALEMIRRINPGTTYLTHISHDMGLHAEVESMLPGNVFLGYDGLTIHL